MQFPQFIAISSHCGEYALEVASIGCFDLETNSGDMLPGLWRYFNNRLLVSVSRQRGVGRIEGREVVSHERGLCAAARATSDDRRPAIGRGELKVVAVSPVAETK